MIFKRSPHVLVHILFNLRSEIQNVQTTPRTKNTLPERLNYPKVIQRLSWSSSKLPKRKNPALLDATVTGPALSAHDVRDALRVAWRIPRCCSKTLGSLESLVAPTYGAMHVLGSKSHMARYGDFEKKGVLVCIPAACGGLSVSDLPGMFGRSKEFERSKAAVTRREVK